MLLASYGAEGGGRSCSLCWKDVVKLTNGGGGIEGRWFEEMVVIKVGGGAYTLFWHDCWLGGVSFRVRFSRLFHLDVNKSIMARNMFLLGWREGGGSLELEEEIVGVGRVARGV